MEKDFYSILGVNRNASKNEINKSYHKLCLKSYPEIDMSSIASDKFRALTQAFRVLSDTRLRNIYDHFGEEELNVTQKAAIDGSGDHTFKESFEQVFNNMKIKSKKPIKSLISRSISDSKIDSKEKSINKSNKKRKSTTVLSDCRSPKRSAIKTETVPKIDRRVRMRAALKPRLQSSSDSEEEVVDIEVGNGFHLDWEPMKVLGATRRQSDQRLLILIAWKGRHSTFEYSEIANQLIPHLVINYYEKKIRWKFNL